MRCVLCARRGRTTEAETHVCVPCAARLQVDVADVLRLAADAAAYVMPGASKGGGGRSVPSSRPPANLDAIQPELAIVDGQAMTVLECLELWERMVRESRGLVRFGPASAARTAQGQTALSGVVNFLGQQVAWMSTEPDFPIDDFADEVRNCLRVLRRWDPAAEDRAGYVVECPHDVDGAACGRRLRIAGDDAESYFTCPQCRTEWSVDRLMLVWAETSDAAMWLDAEAVVRRYGVDRTTLDRWVRNGRMTKWHGLYDIRPLALAQRRS